jgi:hypothetical protein
MATIPLSNVQQPDDTSISLAAGNGSGTNFGGNVTITAGSSNGGQGGSVTITGGADLSGSNPGGSLTISGGLTVPSDTIPSFLTFYGQNDLGGVGIDVGMEDNMLLRISNLPTSDPHVIGAVWNDTGTLKISAG